MTDNTHHLLTELVSNVRCKPGWHFRLAYEDGTLRLVITVSGYDAYDDTQVMRVAHFLPVPMTTYSVKSWQRWLFEMCRRVENHELGEWFRIGDRRPFAPLHGPGEDPYTVHEYRDCADASVLQDGSVGDVKV